MPTAADLAVPMRRRPPLTVRTQPAAGAGNVPLQDFWTKAPPAGFATSWAAGLAPSAAPGDVLDRNSAGAYPLPLAVAATTLRLIGLRSTGRASSGTMGPKVLYDRLVQVGGFVYNVTTAQTVNTPALPRYTDGDNVAAYLTHITSPSGGNLIGTPTISYTNELGVAGRTGTVTGFTLVNVGGLDIAPFCLQAGDRGVRSVESVTLAGAATSAGAFAIMLARPIITFTSGDLAARAGQWDWSRDWKHTGLPAIADNACLNVYGTPAAATGAEEHFEFQVAAL